MDNFKFIGKWNNIEYQFSAFKGLQNRLDAYDTISDTNLSDGTISLNISSELNDTFEPSQAQLDTIDWISLNGDKIRKAILRGLQGYYEKWKNFLDLQDDFIVQYKSVKTGEDLGNILGLSRIFISTTSLDGHCVYGMEGGWSGDPEHGLGIVMIKDRILVFGTQDDMILPSSIIANFDGDYENHRKLVILSYEEKRKLEQRNPNHPTLHKKPKYYILSLIHI